MTFFRKWQRPRPKDGYWRLLDPWWERISIYDGPEVFLRELDLAPEPVRILFCSHWTQSEINNGGFAQFFFNSTGVVAPEARNSFQAIQMPGVATSIEKAASLFGEPYPRATEARRRLLDEWDAAPGGADAKFEDLENEFFDLVVSENGGFESSANVYAALHEPKA